MGFARKVGEFLLPSLCVPVDDDPDELWKQQNKQQEQNPIYKFVNLGGTGSWVEAIKENGPKYTEVLIAEYIKPFLYNAGYGDTISKCDFIRWQQKSQRKLLGKSTKKIDDKTDDQIMASFVEDEFNKPVDHQGCWNLDMRGGVGETPLHICFILDTEAHLEVAKIMLGLYPKLALDYYEGEEYYGESALHIAIVNGDFEMVRLLVENGADVVQRATGRFFLPEDQKKGKSKTTNYKGYAYYGEYPLAFAASFGHEEIYDYLIDHGADPNMCDSFGNTVLHMMVITNQIGMFGYAVKHHAKKADMERENHQHLTPLTLSSKLGRNEIFKEIIELQSIEIWRWSNVTCSTYPLAPLDTIGEGGRTNWSSALCYITEGGTEDHLEMLAGGVIKQLLDDKWKTFARRRFFERLVLACLHLLVLSIAICSRPADSDNLLGPTDTTSIVRYICEIIVCIDSASNLLFQLEEVRSQGFQGLIQNQTSAPAKFIFNLSCILVMLCIPARFLGWYGMEVVCLSLAAPCAWAFLLFFARGAELLGPFVIMIYKMISTDLVRFVIIFIIFLVQFSQGFYFLFKDINKNVVTFKTIGGTVIQLFQMTLGEFRYEDFGQTRLPILTKAVFLVFAILVPILLLNMLIAMMGNTYQQIISRSAKEWKRQWAKIIIVLERTFSRKQLLNFQQEYSVVLSGGGKDGGDTRGLMVIKTSAKTKARQRKGAITNWKKLVNEIKSLIKEQKREGKTGPLDLTSSDVTEKLSERQLRRRRSALTFSNHHDDAAAEEDEPTASGLLSRMTQQLAWEKDIDLSKGKPAIKTDVVLEEDEDEDDCDDEIGSSATSRTYVAITPTPPPQTAPGNNKPGIITRLSSGVDNPSYNNKASRVAESFQLRELTDSGAGNIQNIGSNNKPPLNILKSKRVSPESTALDMKNNDKKYNNKKNTLKGHSSRPPSARSSSGGSKMSKDSAFSEEKGRTNKTTASSSRSSLNSASSLTSLIPAWEKPRTIKKPDDHIDDTDF